jgi:hypothetical protein
MLGSGGRAGFQSTMPKVDHFTSLSRAVAAIDRDSYAARFAVYDREHKALLRQLASADQSVSDADIAREEQAFRDAIRRIEFAELDDEPTLVPQDEPFEAPPPLEPRRPPVWSHVRPPRREDLDVPSSPDLDHIEPAVAGEPVEAPLPEPRRPPVWPQVRPRRRETPDVSSPPDPDYGEPVTADSLVSFSERRSVARRVGERLALAVVALALAGIGLWMMGERRDEATTSSPGVAQSSEPAAAADSAADAKAQPPAWLSPEMFYTPPPAPAPAPPAAPHADVPLPIPRPER